MMPLQAVRFDDLITKLSEISLEYSLCHELNFSGNHNPISMGCLISTQSERSINRAVRVIQELLPKDLMLADCSSAASDCLFELEEAINEYHWFGVDDGIRKMRLALNRLQELRATGYSMTYDSSQLNFEPLTVEQTIEFPSPEISPTAPLVPRVRLVTRKDVRKAVNKSKKAVDGWARQDGWNPYSKHSGRSSGTYDLEAILPHLERRMEGKTSLDWKKKLKESSKEFDAVVD